MKRLALLLLLAAAFTAHAQDRPPATPTPPIPPVPALTPATVRVMGESFLCAVQKTGFQQVTQQRVVEKQGQKVVENVTVNVPFTYTEQVFLDPKTLQAYKTGAKSDDPTKSLAAVETAAIPALLKETRTVRIAYGEKPRPEAIKDLPQGTVILVFPTTKPMPKPEDKK